MKILYANTEARVRYSAYDLTDQADLPAFISQAFPGANPEDMAEAFAALAMDRDSDPATVVLNAGLKQTHLRIAALNFDDDCECGGVQALFAVTISDPDFEAVMRRLEFVLDSTTDGIFIVNRTNHIVYFNKA